MRIEERVRDLLVSVDALGDIFLGVPSTRVVKDARSADVRRAAGMSLGPLDGRLLVVKANIDVEGLSSHAGSLAHAPQPAAQDAPIVKRLRSAGAIVLGHVNMSEFAYSGLGLNPHFGTSPNALDNTLIPGGSSSGSASAVALGWADVALGTDTSGSVRIPAACQGVVGFRPTMNRYDSTGILPLAPSLDTPGPIAKDVSQVCAIDRILSDCDDIGRPCSHFLGFSEDMLAGFSPDIKAMYERALNQLSRQGVVIERRRIDSFTRVTEAFQAHGTLVSAQAFRSLSEFIGKRQAQLDLNVRFRLKQASAMGDADLHALMDIRHSLIPKFSEELAGRMLLYPTLPSQPPSVAAVKRNPAIFSQENARILSVAMNAAFLNSPTISVPFGARVPGHSLSLSAAPNCDADLLATALYFEQLFQ